VKLGCSSSAYRVLLADGRIDLRGWLRICADELEVDGVALAAAHFPTTDALYLRDIKKLCIDLHLTVAGLELETELASPASRPGEIERVRAWCDVAAYIGAPIVTLTAGRLLRQQQAADTGRIVGLFRRVFGQPPPNVRRAWSDMAWALRQCADHAGGRGVVVAVRNQRGALVDAPHQLWQCVRDVGSPWLRACPDPAAMRDRMALDLPLQYAVQVTASLDDVGTDGSDASTHWPEILRLLRAARYRGFLMIDYRGAEPAETAVPRGARFMRGLQHLLARQQMLRSGNGEVKAAPVGSEPVAAPGAKLDAELRELLTPR
jgi:sugar phosphate isomerase/epimerase